MACQGARVQVDIIYEDYKRNFCYPARLEPKRRADFGKLVRMAFSSDIKKRRLGPGGAQVSYYIGLAHKPRFPQLPTAAPDPSEAGLLAPKPEKPAKAARRNSLTAQQSCNTSHLMGYSSPREWKGYPSKNGSESKQLLEVVPVSHQYIIQEVTEEVQQVNYYGGPANISQKTKQEVVTCRPAFTEEWMESLPSYSFFFSSFLSGGC